jgi:polysaccharide biosynthesis/export protein
MFTKCYAAKSMFSLFPAVALFNLQITSTASAQTSAPAADVQLAMANVAYEPFGPGDLVYVSVADCPEATRSYRISPEGDLKLALLREPLRAAGLAPADLEKAISQALVQNHILIDPAVSVSVLEYRSRPVSIVGAVKHSLTFQALGNVKLLDAIARADGFAPDAGAEILINHVPGDSSAPENVQHIRIRELLAAADPSLNIVLHGGEEIRVPEAGKLYIVGNVKTPGAFPLTETGDSSVLKALALCQGLLPYSEKTAYIYRSAPGTTERKEIRVPLHEIVLRKVPDVELQANDIFYIQDNTRKRLTAGALDRITGFGSYTLSSFIIWGH